MSWVEQKHATYFESPIPAGFRNFLSLTAGWDPVANVHTWRQFATYADCAAYWKALIEAPGGPYPQQGSVSDLIYKYAPPEDGNPTEQYIADAVAIMNRLPGVVGGEIMFVPFNEVRVFTVPADRYATGRSGPTTGAAQVRDFPPGSAIECDGFFRGESVQGQDHWLRTSEEHLAIHASGVAEPI